MQWYFWIGIIAATCIAIYMMPQLIKIIKTKDTAGISIAMFTIAFLGDLFFVINGIGILCDQTIQNPISAGLPILLANLVAMAISGVIAFYKVRNMAWARKFRIKEEQIPQHFKEIKSSLAKAKAERKAAKAAEKERLEQAARTSDSNPVKDSIEQ